MSVQLPTVHTRATLRYLRVSPFKIRPVLDLIRGKSVDEAERVLQLSPRGAAGDVLKVLESAVANAEHNNNVPADELYVARAYCDEGPTRKWGQPRARGRYFRIRKRSSHLTIVVARYSDEELEARRRREEQAGGPARGRPARRRAERVRASRRAQQAARAGEHEHDEAHEDEHDEAHDHDHEVEAAEAGGGEAAEAPAEEQPVEAADEPGPEGEPAERPAEES